MRKLSARSRRGTALLISLVAVMTVAGLGVAFLTLSTSNSRVAEYHLLQSRARYLAEAGNEIAQKELMRAIASYEAPQLAGALTVDGRSVSYLITTIQHQRTEQDVDAVQTIYQPYLITTSATVDAYTAFVYKIVDVGKTPIFQYAVFYNNDLEILPGPSMTLAGRVHTNRDMYIATDGTLTVDSPYLRAVGHLFRRRKDSSELPAGNVRVKVKGTSSYQDIERKSDLQAQGIPSVSGFDSDFHGYDSNNDDDYVDPGDMANWRDRSLDRWDGTVLTGEHGIHEAVVPSVACIKRYEPTESGTGGDYTYNPGTGQYTYVGGSSGTHQKAYYHRNAGLVILANRAYNSAGTDITSSLPSGTIGSATLFDGREDKTITVTDIDIAKLNTTTYFPANGLLYAARSDSTAAQPNGIRIKNASTLKATLTIVSEDPVYLWKDYNSVTKKPAAVITDALNILSNAWNNSKSRGNLPVASNTTINAAFITGNSTTTFGQYNGGFENLPRFHENWDGKTCTILGSFVNLWISDYAQGPWIYGSDNYTAPNRAWSYDTDFNDVSKLPPFSPVAVTVQRVAWWSR